MAPQATQQDLSCFPPVARRIAEAIGVRGTIALMRRFGGTENWYIPKALSPDHRFLLVLKVNEATALCEAFAGKTIDIPRGHFMRLLKRLIMQDNRPNKIVAIDLGVSQRYVRQVRQLTRTTVPDRQLPLL